MGRLKLKERGGDAEVEKAAFGSPPPDLDSRSQGKVDLGPIIKSPSSATSSEVSVDPFPAIARGLAKSIELNQKLGYKDIGTPHSFEGRLLAAYQEVCVGSVVLYCTLPCLCIVDC